MEWKEDLASTGVGDSKSSLLLSFPFSGKLSFLSARAEHSEIS